MGYSYPLNLDWSHDEMAQVCQLWSLLEAAYEGGVDREEFLEAYAAFKKIVPSKMEEKQLSRDFEEISGYSLYRTLLLAKDSSTKRLRMETK